MNSCLPTMTPQQVFSPFGLNRKSVIIIITYTTKQSCQSLTCCERRQRQPLFWIHRKHLCFCPWSLLGLMGPCLDSVPTTVLEWIIVAKYVKIVAQLLNMLLNMQLGVFIIHITCGQAWGLAYRLFSVIVCLVGLKHARQGNKHLQCKFLNF